MNKTTNQLFHDMWDTNLTARLLMLTNPVLLPLSLFYLLFRSSYSNVKNLSLKQELNEIWDSGPFGKVLMAMSILGIIPAIVFIIRDLLIGGSKN